MQPGAADALLLRRQRRRQRRRRMARASPHSGVRNGVAHAGAVELVHVVLHLLESAMRLDEGRQAHLWVVSAVEGAEGAVGGAEGGLL
eukprot:scaffold3830_cov324-Prasinococcus_capsulatus_cf.AAC.5